VGFWDATKRAFGLGKARRRQDPGDVAPASASVPPPPTVPGEAWAFDPLQMAFWFGAQDPTHHGTIGLTYDALARMARVPVVAPIISRRINQLAEFAVPQPNRYGIGTVIKMRDPKAHPTRAAQKVIRDLTKLVLTTGGKHGNGSLETFLRLWGRDALIYDQACFEKLYSKGNRPAGFRAVDGSTIRIARPKDLSTGRPPSERQFAQVIQGRIVQQFDGDELAFCVRRPRTDVNVCGYGFPELDEAVQVLQSYLNAAAYNDANFTNGVHVSTILTLKSAMDPKNFAAFTQYVRAMLSGPRNAKKTPILRLDPSKDEELKAVNLSSNNREMEFSVWIGFLNKIIHALFLMDPSESGYVYGNENQTNALASANPRDRIANSKEGGIRPFVRSAQNALNEHIVWPINEDFELEFAGMDSMSETEKLENDVKRCQHFMMVDEIRAEHDMKPLPDGKGQVILNATWLQAAQAAAAPQDGGGQPGDGGDAEGAGPQGPDGAPQLDDETGGQVDDAADAFAAAFGKGATARRVPVTRPQARAWMVEV
jgi:hypothetical protein